jgi:hypothetical protein
MAGFANLVVLDLECPDPRAPVFSLPAWMATRARAGRRQDRSAITCACRRMTSRMASSVVSNWARTNLSFSLAESGGRSSSTLLDIRSVWPRPGSGS